MGAITPPSLSPGPRHGLPPGALPGTPPGMRLTDTHAHLDGYGDELGPVLERAARAGVWRVLAVGTDAASSAHAVELAGRSGAEAGGSRPFPRVMAAVGLHPHEAHRFRKELPRLSELARRGAATGLVAAVGETGLDYYRNLSSRADQRQALTRHTGLARELGLPLIVHDRDAHREVLSLLRSAGPFPAGGIMHCFSGDLDFALEAIQLGFLVSFAGPLTFPKSAGLREIAGVLPLESLVVETDCPYLAPAPFRGKRNEPALVVYTARALAAARGEGLERVTDALEANV
ncbi:MAG: hypothetical protein A2Y96_01925, partial [Firmicutes bacterium RBG_13_65_8]